ncbi:hypothetical protein NBRC111894_4538 [Sporolactobacillus inulinus]|uniref:Uncharacterized protein n=1 Tax=Sporolactobacillus inulinus TaxID=2078 RepID=A0A4Y1ZJ73_9BACL|nr:hypothetical protein NBRC111894_4538 [Sporolactobacillus inulinus]
MASLQQWLRPKLRRTSVDADNRSVLSALGTFFVRVGYGIFLMNHS